jgi:hypothetical protein
VTWLPAQNGGENALGRRIEGTWLLQATLRQCDTGAEIPNSTFPALHTFLSGGAMLSNPATSGLSTGHGVWTHTGGDTSKYWLVDQPTHIDNKDTHKGGDIANL